MRRRAVRYSLIVAAWIFGGSWTASALAQVANNDAYGTAEDQPLSIAAPGIRANDIILGFLSPVIDWGSPSNGALTAISAEGAFTYVPNANFSGVDSFTYQIGDPLTGLVTNTATVTITVTAVNDAPLGVVSRSYSTPEDAPLQIGGPGVLAGVTDVESNALSAQLVSNVAPATGTLSLSANGAFEFTPAANFSGTATFSYRAVDNGVPPAQTAAATVVITVTGVNDAPVANPDGYPGTENIVLSVAAPGVLGNDTDPDAGTQLTAVLATSVPPAAGTLTLNANGSFTFQPALSFNGVTSFTYNTRDNGTPQGQSAAPATVTITVAAVNDAPVAVADSYQTNEDVALTVPAAGVLANDSDAENNALTAVLVTSVAPASGTLSLSPSGSFSYNPAAGFHGTATFTYRVVDDGVPPVQSAPATVVITVTDVNDLPVANPNTYDGSEDIVLSVPAPGVLGNDTDPDVGTQLTAVLATSVPATAGTVTLNANGSFTFRPASNFSGVTSFTYNARDNATPPGQSAAPATVTITVAAVNDAPVAVADSYETNEDVALTVPAAGVLANDTDAENGALTAVLVTSVAPASGTLSLSPNGSFLYSPAAEFFGTATFTYRAVESATPPLPSVATATVTITVRNVNDPPVAVADAFTATEDTTLNVAAPGVLGNDSDPDPSTTLTALAVAPPAHGTLTLNANGSFIYAAVADYNGPDSFTYRVRDNATPPLDSGVVTVTVNVASANDAPRLLGAALPSQTATENVPFALALAPFFRDPEDSPLTFAVTGLPPGLTATPAGVIGGMPTLNLAVGTFTVNVAVSDGQSQFTAPFTLVVLAAGRTDLALSATAAPSPALINQPVTWTFAIDNRSPVETVGNLTLQVVFSGPPSLVITPGPRCTAAPQAGGTAVSCAAGPVAASGAIAVPVMGSSAQPGDVVAVASIAITDNVPVDATPANDTATVVLNIAQSLAAGPAQTLPGVGYRASASGDFNGDGFIDLAIATEGGMGTLIYPNVIDTGTPGGTKRALAAEPIPLGDAGVSTGIAVADLDGDRALDLVIAKASGPSAAFRNPNDGTFGFVGVITALGAAGDVTHSVAAHDLDGDSRVDIVLGNTGTNRVFTNQGSWTFTQVGVLGNDDSRDSVVVDLAGDSAPELVFANANRGATVYAFDSHGPLPGDGTCERAGNVGGGRGPRRQRPCGPGVRPRTSEGRAVQHGCTRRCVAVLRAHRSWSFTDGRCHCDRHGR